MSSRSLSARSAVGLSGLAVVVVFGGGSAIWGLDMPEPGTPASEIVDFYRDTADRIVIGASLSVLAIAIVILFAAALRQVMIEAGADEFLATTAFGGAVLGMAAGLGAETINMVGALRARDGNLDPELARALFEIPQILGSYASGAGGGVFAVATAAAALRTGAVLPRWIAVVLLVVGIVLLSPLSHLPEVTGGALVLMGLLIGVPMLREPAPVTRSPGTSA